MDETSSYLKEKALKALFPHAIKKVVFQSVLKPYSLNQESKYMHIDMSISLIIHGQHKVI